MNAVSRPICVFVFLIYSLSAATAQTFFAQKQSTVDSFPIIAGNTDLYGSIVLNGGSDPANDIHDLTPLLQLKVLTGALSIVHTTRLKSLHGLDSLIYIGGLFIYNNDSLERLSGLNPRYINGDNITEISKNRRLQDIDALNKHEQQYDFRIRENPVLRKVSGLQSLRFCPYINISDNAQLDTFSISKLRKSSSFLLYNNANLQSLQFPALDSLIYFESRIELRKCPRLKNLDGIHPQFIEGQLVLKLLDNDSLRQINAAGQWPVEVLGYWAVRNPLLEEIAFPGVKRSIGQLVSQNNALKSIDLPALEWATGNFGTAVSISHNPMLATVSMPKLKTIARLKDSLYIFNCPKLSSLEGFSSLENVNGRILIGGLKSLKNLHGFENLRYTAGFEIGGFYNNGRMDSLESLCPFQHFTCSRFDVQMLNCPRLSSLAGLETLKKTGFVRLAWLDSLKNLDGLLMLDTLRSDSVYTSGWILIDSTGLEDISGIKHLRDFGTKSNLRILNSHKLKKVELLHLSQGAEFWVKNCRALQDIQVPALQKLSNDDGIAFLFLDNLPELLSLDGFKSLKSFTAPFSYNNVSKIRIRNNAQLIDCDAVCKMRQSIPATYFDIQNNAFPCQTLLTIEENVCDSMSAVAAPENMSKSMLRISPNPAQDFLTLTWLAFPDDKAGTECTLNLISSQGRSVFTQSFFGQICHLDVSRIPPGIYFLQLIAEGRLMEYRKVVVLR